MNEQLYIYIFFVHNNFKKFVRETVNLLLGTFSLNRKLVDRRIELNKNAQYIVKLVRELVLLKNILYSGSAYCS